MGRKANRLQREINRIGAMLPVRSDDDGNVGVYAVYSAVRRALEQIGAYEQRFLRLAELIDNKHGRVRPATVDTVESGIRQLLSERDRARVAEREDVNQIGLRRLSEALGVHGKGYLETLSFDDIEEAIVGLTETYAAIINQRDDALRQLDQTKADNDLLHSANRGLVAQIQDNERQNRDLRRAVDRREARLVRFLEVRDRISAAMQSQGFFGGVEEQVTRMIRFMDNVQIVSGRVLSAEQVRALGENSVDTLRKHAETAGQSLLDYVDRYGPIAGGYAEGGLIPRPLNYTDQEKK